MTDATPPLPGPLFYLTGEYPRATDTFIQREVAALRELGVDVRTATVRPTDAAHHVGPEQRTEAAATFAVQTAARNPRTLLASHWACLRRAPLRWLRAIWLGLRTGRPGLRGLLWQIFYTAEAGVLAEHLHRADAFHLHNHFGNSSCSVAMIAAAMAGIPYSYTLHGPMELFEPMAWRIDEKIARASFVACISHFARSQGMLFSDPRHWQRMHVVHCGVDPALYDAPQRPAGAAPVLLFVGRLAAIKGLGLLLEAVAALRGHYPALRLVVVGDGTDRARLEARASLPDLAGAVTFTGYRAQAEVARELAACDVFVLPSFAEGVPVVLMEAMASRRPVVATRVAGVAELVEDGVSGHLVAPGDPAALTKAIEALLADPVTRTRMGEAGRRRVEAEFDARREAAWLLAILRARRVGGPELGLRPEAG